MIGVKPPGHLLVTNVHALPAAAPAGVVVQPAWEWLLQTPEATDESRE